MGLFDLFSKKESSSSRDPNSAAVRLSGFIEMRLQVSSMNEELLFMAILAELRGNDAVLEEYAGGGEIDKENPIPVKMRGYSPYTKNAASMEATVSAGPDRIWFAENITDIKIGNERMFFRLNTQTDGTAVYSVDGTIVKAPCRILNISAGGALIICGRAFAPGTKLLLKFRLVPDGEDYSIFSRVLRNIAKKNEKPKYGCQFVDIKESVQDMIIKDIFTLELKKRGRL